MARQELRHDPNSSLGDIAASAGVTRRTIYSHFSGRAALVHDLAADSAEAIRLAMNVNQTPVQDPATALARCVLTLWSVGDRYRTLFALARQDCQPDRLDALLAPARDTVAKILARGQGLGVFHAQIPPGALSRAIEAHVMALLDSGSSGVWIADGARAATAALITAGVPGGDATATVHRVHCPA